MRESFKRLMKDEGGAVVVWTSVGLLGFIAIGSLVLDGVRMVNLHSQMQAYADHAALAAAAELAGDGEAIGRAIRAANGFTVGETTIGPIVTATENYSFDRSNLTITTMRFLSRLGTGQERAGELVDGDVVEYTHAVGSALPSAETLRPLSQRTRYVQVIAAPRNVNFVMAPILTAFGIGAGAGSSAVTAGAVAGFTRIACRFPPLMICNPTENPALPGGGPFNWESMVGRQILLKSQSGQGQWAPGNFGLLDLTKDIDSPHCSGGGGNFVRCVLGLADPGTQCVLQDAKVDPKPGNNEGPTGQGFNVRFDIWDPPMQSNRGNAAFAPARNVIKGRTHGPNQCREMHLTETNAPSVPLPQDPGISHTNKIGNGITLADLKTYWTTNHPDTAWPFPEDVKPTRYEIYRKEIELNPRLVGEESMTPTCAAPVSEPANMDMVRDRRVLIAAVVNCAANNVRGSMQGSGGVTVENFAIMFITEPVVEGAGNGPGEGIFGEMLGLVKANTENGVLHEFPVLYR